MNKYEESIETLRNARREIIDGEVYKLLSIEDMGAFVTSIEALQLANEISEMRKEVCHLQPKNVMGFLNRERVWVFSWTKGDIWKIIDKHTGKFFSNESDLVFPEETKYKNLKDAISDIKTEIREQKSRYTDKEVLEIIDRYLDVIGEKESEGKEDAE